MVLSKKVFELVKRVPGGRVTTYLEIARALNGNPKLARVVGNLLNKNRDLENVPCFRVVRSDGTVGGYILGTDEKIRRLEKSGVRIEKGRIADFEDKLFRFQPPRRRRPTQKVSAMPETERLKATAKF